MAWRKIAMDELRSNVLSAIVSASMTVAGALAIAIWAAVDGWSGAAIALAALAAAALVSIVVLAVGLAARRGFLKRRAVKLAGRIALAILGISILSWVASVVHDVRDLRTEVNELRGKVPENPDHREELARGSRAEEDLNKLRPELARIHAQNDLLTAQLTTATTRINSLEAQLDQRARVTLTRAALNAAQKEGIALRSDCAKYPLDQYTLRVTTWTDSVESALTSRGWTAEAARWRNPQPPRGIPRLVTPGCGSQEANIKLATGVTVLLYLIDDIASGLGN